MIDSTTIKDFIEESRRLGYDISGSVFKVDYNGSLWTVGFWIRPANWNIDRYDLPGRIGKARHRHFKTAIKNAIEKALEFEGASNE